MNCVQGGVTFIWGGAGIPTIDEVDGDFCSCACGSEGWLNHNILGGTSCVPTRAHTCFGAIGIAVSVSVLNYAIQPTTSIGREGILKLHLRLVVLNTASCC